MRTMATTQSGWACGHARRRGGLGLILFITLAVMGWSGARAQAIIGGNAMLGPRWIDDMDGFEIRPPAQCEVLKRKLKVPRVRHGGVVPVAPGDLVTFVNSGLRWGIIIHLSELQKDVSLSTLLAQTVAEAKYSYHNVRVLTQRITTNSGRPAGILVLHFTTVSNKKPVVMMRQQLMVRAAPRLYYLLTFFSPGNQANGARSCFAAMIKTFHLLNIAKIQKERAAAVIAGRKWIRGLTAEMMAQKSIPSQLFEIRLNGHGIGYVLLSAYSGLQDGYKGEFCATNARTFLPNGEVIFSKVTSFWADARQGGKPGPPIHYATWDKAVQIMVPINNPQVVKMRQERIVIDPKTNKPKLEHIHIPYPNMEIHWARETGDEQSASVPALDAHGHPTDFFVSHRWMTVYTQRGHVLPGQSIHPVHFELPSYMPAFFPPVLTYFWPRFTTLTKPSAMAFVVYDSTSKNLGLEMLRVRGQRTMLIHGNTTKVYHLTDQLDPGIADLWVTANGDLVKYTSPDGSTWTPTTTAAMDHKWKARLAALKE